MRSNQVWKFYYQKGYFDLNLFSNLPENIKNLKKKLTLKDRRLKVNKYQTWHYQGVIKIK